MDVNHSASAFANASPYAAQQTNAQRPAAPEPENLRVAAKQAASSKRDNAAPENGRPAQLRDADEVGRRKPVLGGSAGDAARTDNRRGTSLDIVV